MRYVGKYCRRRAGRRRCAAMRLRRYYEEFATPACVRGKGGMRAIVGARPSRLVVGARNSDARLELNHSAKLAEVTDGNEGTAVGALWPIDLRLDHGIYVVRRIESTTLYYSLPRWYVTEIPQRYIKNGIPREFLKGELARRSSPTAIETQPSARKRHGVVGK